VHNYYSGGILKVHTVSDGEDGANPSRCRHCKRGVTLPNATVCLSTWEGAENATSRKSGDPTAGIIDTLRVKGRFP